MARKPRPQQNAGEESPVSKPSAWEPGRIFRTHKLEEPYEGIPPHLSKPLREWVIENLGHSNSFGEIKWHTSIINHLTIALRVPDTKLTDNSNESCMSFILNDDFLLLDSIEFILKYAKSIYFMHSDCSNELNDILLLGNSAYMVNDDQDGLERRVTSGVKELVSETVASSPASAGDHLTHAWNAAYGRATDPVKAYSEAIKAVEAAFIPRVSPQNKKQTLGTMIRDISSKPEKWSLAHSGDPASGVETVLSMMKLLWAGQTSRHGSDQPPRPETMEEAQVAVHLAATLVQLGNSKTFDHVNQGAP